MTKKETTLLDNKWSKLVKTIAEDRCEYCGRPDRLNSHHIFSRSKRSTRWDIDNGVCLCAGHHTLLNWSAHKAPIEFIEWIREQRGETWYQRLRLKANQTVRPDYNLEKLYLEKKMKKYENC